MGLRDEGFRVYDSGEILGFRIRGGFPEEKHSWQEQFEWEYSEEFIKGLKARGYNVYNMAFSKGYGIEAEARDRQIAKRGAEICHKYGMYAGGYFRLTTFVPENIKQYLPDCVERFAGNTIFGPPARYNHQYWRYMPCPSSQDFLDYFDRLIGLAIDEVRLDYVHIDGVALRLEPFTCHCRRCHDGFRQWLQDRYPTADQQYQRFGFSGFDHVELPDYRFAPVVSWVNPILTEPIGQEWVFFRCHLLGKIWRFLVEATHRRKPDCFIDGNTSLYPHLNVACYSGVEIHRMLSCGADGLCSEEPNRPCLTSDDRLHGQFETFKKLRRLGAVTFLDSRLSAYTDEPEGKPSFRRSMACNMAFGQELICAETRRAEIGKWPDADLEYLAFHRDRRELFLNTRPAHDLVMYYSGRTETLNCGTPIATKHLATDALVHAHVPFGCILAEHHKDIFDYQAVVLPEIECLSDSEVTTLVSYVRQGGGLVIIGSNTGRFNEVRRLRPKRLDAELGVEFNERSPAFQARIGAGRVAYIPVLTAPEGTPQELVAQARKKTLPYFELEPWEWHSPRNGSDLLNAVRWVSRGFSFELTVPNTTVVEYWTGGNPKRYLIHLVNFDLKHDVGPFEITTRRIGQPTNVEVFSPDDLTPKARICQANGPDEGSIRVGGFHRYIIVVMDMVSP